MCLCICLLCVLCIVLCWWAVFFNVFVTCLGLVVVLLLNVGVLYLSRLFLFSVDGCVWISERYILLNVSE